MLNFLPFSLTPLSSLFATCKGSVSCQAGPLLQSHWGQVTGHGVLWLTRLAGRKVPCRRGMLRACLECCSSSSLAWFPIAGGSGAASQSCLSQKYSAVTLVSDSHTFFVFLFFFLLGLGSRERWWDREPLCHTRSGGTQGLPSQELHGWKKQYRHLRWCLPLSMFLGLPAAFRLLGYLISGLALLPPSRYRPGLLLLLFQHNDSCWNKNCTWAAFCSQLCKCRSVQQRAELETGADLPLHLPLQCTGECRITQLRQMASGTKHTLL